MSDGGGGAQFGVASCPRCGLALEREEYGGCPSCRAAGLPVNLAPPLADLHGRRLEHFPGGPWGWRQTLPIAADTVSVTLGEGNTPNVNLHPGPDGSMVWVKNESTNPTWSHKDRGHSVGVTKAIEKGATTIIAASSGNAGAASAAYAARAGIRCVVLTSPQIPREIRAMIEAYGAVLVACESYGERNALIEMAVESLGWFPTTLFGDPTPGSNFYVVEGYKSIAYELARDLGDRLRAVVVPTSVADISAGLHRGFLELVQAGLVERMPSLIAAEPENGAAFTAAFQKQDHDDQCRTRITRHESPAFSLGSDTPTWQGLAAMWETGGWPVAVPIDVFMNEFRWMSRRDGLFVEPSAAVAVAAARLVWQDIGGEGDVVAISSSSGLKDPGAVLERVEDLAVLPADPEQLNEHVERVAPLATRFTPG